MEGKTSQKEQIPCLEGFFTMPPQEPQLIGGRCESCGAYSFPAKKICGNPDCDRTKPVKKVLLSRRGKLWTYAIDYYPPPPPYHAADPFIPFGVAFVTLPEGINVSGQITAECDLETLQALKIGMEMEVIREKLYEDDGGREVLTWKFKPVQGGK